MVVARTQPAPAKRKAWASERSSSPEEAATRSEIAEVVEVAYSASRHLPIDLEGSLADVPLKVHASYQREEILAALDFPHAPGTFREGVWWAPERNIDAFLITLQKSMPVLETANTKKVLKKVKKKFLEMRDSSTSP